MAAMIEGMTAEVIAGAARERADGDGRASIAQMIERKTMTVDEAARVLGVGRTACYDAARRREIPTIRIGRRLLVPRAALERLMSGEAA